MIEAERARAELLAAASTHFAALDRFDSATVAHWEAIARALEVPEDDLVPNSLYRTIGVTLLHMGRPDLLRAWVADSSVEDLGRIQALMLLGRHGAEGRRYASADVPAISAILTVDQLANQIELIPTPDLLRPVLQRERTFVAFHGALLSSLLAINSEEARAELRRVATNPALTAPNPLTLTALGCPKGNPRDDSLAQALASERWLALVLLGERALLQTAASEADAPPFFKKWLTIVLNAQPYWTRSPLRTKARGRIHLAAGKARRNGRYLAAREPSSRTCAQRIPRLARAGFLGVSVRSLHVQWLWRLAACKELQHPLGVPNQQLAFSRVAGPG